MPRQPSTSEDVPRSHNVNLQPLSFACPQCGSTDVVYSCQPSCCFNHVCSYCYTTFEPTTQWVGELKGEIGPLPPTDCDPNSPTASCARCGEIRLFTVSSGSYTGQILCVSCKALLTIDLQVG